ncbi:hypothetical protein DL96DRAFT_1617400, partial [Flagelloscypha sp. PMI_526]
MALPLDLLPIILTSLDRPDLRTCTLVTIAFRHVALPLLFSQVTLCSETWQKKCAFLLEEAGIQLRSNIRKITVEIEDIPIFTVHSETPSSLRLVLQEIGPQLDTLCIESKDEISWEELHSIFWDIVVTSMPHISTLELLGIGHIPLLTTLSHFPILGRLYLKSDGLLIGEKEEEVHIDDLPSLPKVSSLSIDCFVEEDFGKAISLGRYILAVGDGIQSLTLVEYSGDEFPLYWNFLRPYTRSLQHLTLGTHLFHTVVDSLAKPDAIKDNIVNFRILPKLQSITFHIPNNAFSQDWWFWASWIARTMENTTETPVLPLLAKLTFIFTSSIVPDADCSTTLDDLVLKSSFEIHTIISCHTTTSFSEMVGAFRGCLPSWNAAGRLKFWM